MRIPKHLLLLIALLVSASALPSPAAAVAGIEGGIGLGYLTPRSNEVSDLYDGGPCFHLLLARGFERPALAVGLEIGYFRSTSTLSAPFFVSSAEATLQWLPIDLIVRAPLLTGGGISPYLGAGLEFLWSRERFSYRLADAGRERQPEDRFDPGLVLVAGIDRQLPPRLRIEGFLSIVPAQRKVSLDGTTYEAGGDNGFDAGALGVRIHWRLP